MAFPVVIMYGAAIQRMRKRKKRKKRKRKKKKSSLIPTKIVAKMVSGQAIHLQTRVPITNKVIFGTAREPMMKKGDSKARPNRRRKINSLAISRVMEQN